MILTQNYGCGMPLAVGVTKTTLRFDLSMNQFFETYKEVYLIKMRHVLTLKRNDLILAINDGDPNAGALRQMIVSYFLFSPLPVRNYAIESISGTWFPQNSRWDSVNHNDVMHTFLRLERDNKIIAESNIDVDLNMTFPTFARLQIQYFFEVF